VFFNIKSEQKYFCSHENVLENYNYIFEYRFSAIRVNRYLNNQLLLICSFLCQLTNIVTDNLCNVVHIYIINTVVNKLDSFVISLSCIRTYLGFKRSKRVSTLSTTSHRVYNNIITI